MSNARMLRIALPLICLIPTALAAQVPADLANAIRARDGAEFALDAVAWDRLTADEFTIVLADGILMTKAQRLAQMRSQGPTIRPLFYIDGVLVSEGGERAPLARPDEQVPGYAEEQITAYSTVFVRRFLRADSWILEIWVKDHAQWRVRTAQMTSATRANISW
jgi:hypothetical protein